ncbi:MAG: LCP family protein [Nocardioidaceae bacterium]|nr:LCP family protein [Nocardioidaceae bacterium]
MSWGSDPAPLHRGRHRAPRPDLIGRALRRALLATLLPGVLLAVAGLVVRRTASSQVVDAALSADTLLWIVVGLGVVWLLWVGLICRTYARNRSRTAPRAIQLVGGAAVFLLCAAVTAPMAMGAQYALVQRDLLRTIFHETDSATTPKATKSNPWGHRKRVNVLLLGGDGAIHRPGVRTDSVILASIEVKTGKAVLFSLPRNLQNVPFKPGSKLAELYPNGFTDGTANNAEFFLNAVYRNVPAVHPGVLGKSDNEGADAVKLAVSGALGLRVDYYVLVNLDGFSKLVDAIGGITVNINERVPIGGNTDAHILPDDYLEPGPEQRLNGFKALWFTRGRYGSTDYKRMERQRCAINAIVKEASPVKVLQRYRSLARTAKEIVRTDIPAGLLSAFVDLAGKVKGQKLEAVGFERSDEFDPNEPDFDFVHTAVQAALHPVRKPATQSVSGVTPPAASDEPSPPSKASDADDDCAYHPTEGTPTS